MARVPRALPAKAGLRDELLLLVLASVLAAGLAVFGAPLALRLPFGLVAVLFLPGYSLIAALFPRADELGTIERIAAGFGLSAAVAIALLLALDYAPWGIRPTPIVLILAGWTVSATAVAWWRRSRLEPDERFVLPFLSAGPWARTARDWPRVALCAGVLVLCAAALALTLGTPPPPVTEFFIVGPSGRAEDYPRAARPGTEVVVTVGVTNREGVTATYRVAVVQETRALATTTSLILAPGQTWHGPVRFTLPTSGRDQEIGILLFKDGHPEPYRRLRLWVDGLSEETAR